jgi:hypothetical protein
MRERITRPTPGQRDGAEPQQVRRSAEARAARGSNLELLTALGLRTKPPISKPGDPDERQADRVADAFMRGQAAPGLARGTGAVEPAKRALPDPARSAGQALPPAVRREYEGFFRVDLSSVRIRTDASAAALARGIGARAFAHDKSIYFAQGRYQPHSRTGRRLLAHEIAHTLQGPADGAHLRRTPKTRRQQADPPRPSRSIRSSEPIPPASPTPRSMPPTRDTAGRTGTRNPRADGRCA